MDTDSACHHLTHPAHHVLDSSTPPQEVTGFQRQGRVASAAPLNLTPPSHMTHSHMSPTTFYEYQHENTHSIAPLDFTPWLLIFSLHDIHYEYYGGAFWLRINRGVVNIHGIITVEVGSWAILYKPVLIYRQAHAQHVLINPSNKTPSAFTIHPLQFNP